jgi:hypothetical protein
MEYQTILASGIMGMIGTAVGVVLNNRLSRSSQRDQWLADAKKAEYKELISTLHESFMTMLELNRRHIAFGPNEQRELLRAETKSFRTIADRIYIADRVTRMDLMNRWGAAVQNYKNVTVVPSFDFGTEVSKISDELRQAALQDH